MTALVSRMMFHNNEALQAYAKGTFPLVKDIIRDVYVEEWRVEHQYPDHYLKNRRDLILHLPSAATQLAALPTLSRLMLDVLDDIGDRYLVWNGNRISVIEDYFGEWQTLLPRLSPLLIMSRKVQREAGPCPTSQKARSEYVERWLKPNFLHSALPYPYNPLIEGLIRRKGLIETHCHLNGSTEADTVWLDAVTKPEEFHHKIREIFGGWQREIVQEQYQQIEAGLNPTDIWLRLHAAGKLRSKLCGYLFDLEPLSPDEVQQITAIVLHGLGTENSRQSSRRHVAETNLWSASKWGEMVLEAGFLTLLLAELDNTENDVLAHAFYFCQLVCTQIIKLTVQQVEQVGFDQFQKITVNEARSQSEQGFKRRFQQMGVGEAGSIRFIEGRFSPKSAVPAIRKDIHTIQHGFDACYGKIQHGNRAELGLVCHFIKSPENLRPAGCRHYKLRQSIQKKGRVLVTACDPTQPFPLKPLTGIDAASNELHAPPEVFSPLFRFLRRRGVRNFTYHVGEDFVHLLSGMRAIHEAVTFLSLRPGNRIGHGTAIGIDPEFWRGRVGEFIVMSRGNHLDDLVFAHQRLIGDTGFAAVVAKLEGAIEKLSRDIYGISYSPNIHYKAWSFRSIDPLLAFNRSRFKHFLFERDRTEESDLLQGLEGNDEARDLFYHYHGQGHTSLSNVLDNWNKLIEVKSDIVPPSALWHLQEIQLNELICNNIAIESLPTSNVRIGFYCDYSEHHLFRWLGISSKAGKQPIVCLGSDDPGIFATSIRVEYYHVYRELTQ